MKHLKKFENYSTNEQKPVNEEIVAGALVLGGVGLIIGANAIVGKASSMWNKFMMKKRFKETGKTEDVKYGKGDGSIHFVQYKDNTDGKLYWGSTFSTNPAADPGYETIEWLLYSEDRFKEIKEICAKAEGIPSKGFSGATSHKWEE